MYRPIFASRHLIPSVATLGCGSKPASLSLFDHAKFSVSPLRSSLARFSSGSTALPALPGISATSALRSQGEFSTMSSMRFVRSPPVLFCTFPPAGLLSLQIPSKLQLSKLRSSSFSSGYLVRFASSATGPFRSSCSSLAKIHQTPGYLQELAAKQREKIADANPTEQYKTPGEYFRAMLKRWWARFVGTVASTSFVTLLGIVISVAIVFSPRIMLFKRDRRLPVVIAAFKIANANQEVREAMGMKPDEMLEPSRLRLRQKDGYFTIVVPCSSDEADGLLVIDLEPGDQIPDVFDESYEKHVNHVTAVRFYSRCSGESTTPQTLEIILKAPTP